MGYTTNPEVTLIYRSKIPSVARNASATLTRLLAESSNVRSNHWAEAVHAGFKASIIT